MKFTLITPTGDRPEAFALCESYMARQTKSYFQWLVYDDGKTPTKCTMRQEYIYCPQYSGPGSLSAKLFDVFIHAKAKGEAVAFIEDDDWYHPTYLEVMDRRLEAGYDLVGEGKALYYNVAKRWWSENGNMKHASLCQTVARRNIFHIIARLCYNTNPFLDVRLWKAIGRRHVFPPATQHLLIGIKAMPGRKGYGIGHSLNPNRNFHPDNEMVKLKELIGADADNYGKYLL